MDKNQSQSSFCVFMPCFNEGDRVGHYISQLADQLEGLKFQLVLVDDCSSDDTARVALSSARASGINISVTSNDENEGHGPSLLRGLDLAVKTGCDYLLSVDGDGQVSASSVRKMANKLEKESLRYLGSRRDSRSSDFLRSMISNLAGFLVFVLSGSVAKDANSPARGFSLEFAEKYLDFLKGKSFKTPNILLTVYSQRIGMRQISEIKWQTELDLVGQGSTWKTPGISRVIKILIFATSSAAEIFSHLLSTRVELRDE